MLAEKSPIWTCMVWYISYWNWGSSIATWVFGGVKDEIAKGPSRQELYYLMFSLVHVHKNDWLSSLGYLLLLFCSCNMQLYINIFTISYAQDRGDVLFHPTVLWILTTRNDNWWKLTHFVGDDISCRWRAWKPFCFGCLTIRGPTCKFRSGTKRWTWCWVIMD